MLISTPSAATTANISSTINDEPIIAPVRPITSTTTKWSDFSVSSLCKDIKKDSKNLDGYHSDNATIVGGLTSNCKLDLPVGAVNFTAAASISTPSPILNSVLPSGVQSIAGKKVFCFDFFHG